MKKTLPPISRTISVNDLENHGKLGKRIEIGSTALMHTSKAGSKREWFVPTVEVVIGIGKDHVAYLTMDDDAWKALKKGQKINITSLPQFIKGLL